MSARGTRPWAARPAGTGARTPPGSPPGARPAGPYRSGPARARPLWRPSAATTSVRDEQDLVARVLVVGVLLLEVRLGLGDQVVFVRALDVLAARAVQSRLHPVLLSRGRHRP